MVQISPGTPGRRDRVHRTSRIHASVIDSRRKAHDLDNLYVVDASCFVSASAVNPSLTIIANATRIADHLLADRLK